MYNIRPDLDGSKNKILDSLLRRCGTKLKSTHRPVQTIVIIYYDASVSCRFTINFSNGLIFDKRSKNELFFEMYVVSQLLG